MKQAKEPGPLCLRRLAEEGRPRPRRHVGDEFETPGALITRRKAALLALDIKRDLSPIVRAVGRPEIVLEASLGFDLSQPLDAPRARALAISALNCSFALSLSRGAFMRATSA
jgi:hypothetical protein